MTKNSGIRGFMRPVEFAWCVAGLTAYVVLLVGGKATVDASDPAWQRGLLATALIVVALFTVGISFRAARRAGEVDRVVVSEATSVAFFVTMIAALTYGLLEATIDAPRLSAWNVWMLGMGTWAICSTVYRRKLY